MLFRFALSVVFLTALLAAGAVGWWMGQAGSTEGDVASSVEVEVPSPESLLRRGTRLEFSQTLQLVPGQPPALAILSSAEPQPECVASGINLARRLYLEVFSFNQTEHSWEMVLSAAEWPPSAPLVDDPESQRPRPTPAFGDVFAGSVPCLAERKATVQVVRIQPNSDYLAVTTFVHGGAGQGTGRVVLLGWLDDVPTLLLDESRIGPITSRTSGSELLYEANLYQFGDANCCPSGRLETKVVWDDVSKRVMAATQKAIPNCSEGSIIRTETSWNTTFIKGEGEPADGRGLSSPVGFRIVVSCERTGVGGTYSARTTFTIDQFTSRIDGKPSSTLEPGRSSSFEIGERVKIAAWNLAGSGQLIAADIAHIP